MTIENPGANEVEGSPEESANEVIESIDKGNESSAESDEASESLEESSDKELAEVLEDSDSSEEEVAEAKEELVKRISMKVNGKEEDFDLSNDEHIERLKQMAQKGEGADQKFQEASKMRKQMEAFAQLMQKDPIAALKKLGHDPDKIAELHMQKRIEEMQKSPDQIEREKLQKEVEDIKAERDRLANDKHEAEKKVAQETYSRQLDNEIAEALSTSEMPKTPYVVKRLAEYMMIGLKRDSNFQVADAVPLVERQIKKELQEMLGDMPEDVIERILGKKVSDKLRKRRINKMKKVPQTASNVKQTGKAEIRASQPKVEEKPAQSAKSFFSDWGDL